MRTFAEFRDVLNQRPLTLVYFSAPGCTVCHALRPKVERLLASHPAWRFVPVDTVAAPEIAGQLTVFAVPTVMLFVEGREARRLPRSFALDELADALARYEALAGG